MEPTEAKPLFDIPPEKRREAFVRTRFAQEDVFGRPDIEAWLAEQREAEKSATRTWRKFIEAGRVRMDEQLEIERISDFACPQKVPAGFFLAQEQEAIEGACVSMLLESIDRERTDVYPASPECCLFILKVDGKAEHAFTLQVSRTPGTGGGDHQYTLRLASPRDVLLAILSRGWEVGPKKIAEAARGFLCAALAEEITRERAKAEADFDAAVAVSADGTKIVHADWVVVLGPNYPRLNRFGFVDGRIPASAFRDHKILLTGPCSGCQADSYRTGGDGMKLHPWRNHPSGADWTVELFFRDAHQPADASGGYEYGYHALTAHTRASPPEQKLLCFTDGRVFLTHREQYPFPLPDGGVEVTV